VLVLAFTSFSEARIVNRKVKEAPRTCATMKEDTYLSRDSKRIFGTLRSSVIIENQIRVVDDLGKKICDWPIEKLSQVGNPLDFNFYIDEYKNRLYPHVKKEDGYVVMTVNLEDCSLAETALIESLDFPKCEKPLKKKRSSKKKRKS